MSPRTVAVRVGGAPPTPGSNAPTQP